MSEQSPGEQERLAFDTIIRDQRKFEYSQLGTPALNGFITRERPIEDPVTSSQAVVVDNLRTRECNANIARVIAAYDVVPDGTFRSEDLKGLSPMDLRTANTVRHFLNTFSALMWCDDQNQYVENKDRIIYENTRRDKVRFAHEYKGDPNLANLMEALGIWGTPPTVWSDNHIPEGLKAKYRSGWSQVSFDLPWSFQYVRRTGRFAGQECQYTPQVTDHVSWSPSQKTGKRQLLLGFGVQPIS